MLELVKDAHVDTLETNSSNSVIKKQLNYEAGKVSDKHLHKIDPNGQQAHEKKRSLSSAMRKLKPQCNSTSQPPVEEASAGEGHSTFTHLGGEKQYNFFGKQF